MRFREIYGSNVFHLLTLIAGFALFGFVVATVGLSPLWNPRVWWQSIVVWFAGAIIFHDLVLFPIYALADRALAFTRRIPTPRAPVVNFVRIPLLASGLLLLVFLPGIIEQGAPAYLAATGQTQEPFLGRWLLLTAAIFGVSAVAYAIRVVAMRREATAPPTKQPPADRPGAAR